MAKVQPSLNAPRGASLYGRAIYYWDRGRWLVRKWPRKTGPSPSLKIQRQNKWFKDTCAWIKYAAPEQYALAATLAEGTNLYPRDILMKAASGTLYDLSWEDGTPFPRWIPKVEPVMFQGFRLHRAANLACAAGVDTPIPWDTVDIDTAGFFNPADPTWIQIPTNVNTMLFFGGTTSGLTGSTSYYQFLRSNGGVLDAINFDFTNQANRRTIATGPIPTGPGVKFQLAVLAGANWTLSGSYASFFSGVVVGAS